MKAYHLYWRQGLAATLATGVVVLLEAATAAVGQSQPPLPINAHENTRQQIEALIADKEQWTQSQQKLDTQLLFGARLKSAGLVHPAAPKLRPSLRTELDGRIKVDIKCTVTAELLAAIQSAGGTIVSSLPDYHTVQAVLPVENIETIAARDDIKFIRPAQSPMPNYIDSQGDTTHEASVARADFPATGAGIKVGVISDSIDNGAGALSAAAASDNSFNTNLFWITGQAGTNTAPETGEGLAMCEIVHDLAPRATMIFATYKPNDAQMASNILTLAQLGCKIICDDISYPDESPFQDGVIARAVSTVSAEGVLYFSCARNSGNADDYSSCTWEGDFVNGGSASGNALRSGSGQFYHAFAPGLNYDSIAYGGESDSPVDLFWSDPLGASTNDYDLYLVDSTGSVLYSSENVQNGTQDPYETINNALDVGTGYSVVVVKFSGTNRFLHLDVGRGALTISTPGCIRGHNACDATNSFTVAATPATTAYNTDPFLYPVGPYPGIFATNNRVEFFSSDGPRRMFYTTNGTPITPGNFSSTGGRVLQKPDITAADGVATSLPSGSGLNPFYGTSAATPHAAAIAALVWSYNTNLTASQVRTVLTNSCVDIMSPGWDRDSGYGILMALTALQNTTPPSASGQPSFVSGSFQYLDNGEFKASVSGVIGSNYDILVSTNLQTWSNLTVLAMTNTSSIFTDTNARTGRRFYRAELVP